MRKSLIAAVAACCAASLQAATIDIDVILKRDLPGVPPSPLIAANYGPKIHMVGHLYFDPNNLDYNTGENVLGAHSNIAWATFNDDPLDITNTWLVIAINPGIFYLSVAGKDQFGVNFIFGGSKFYTPSQFDYFEFPQGIYAPGDFTSVGSTMYDGKFPATDLTAISGTVTFSGDFPRIATPEPASWALMMGGFALVGVAMRQRKVAASFA